MLFLTAHRSGKDAEKAASRAVMDFLAAQHPRLRQSARRFYVSSQGKAYTCGIALQTSIDAPPGLEIITHPAGEYAVLEGDCCGDAGAYEAVLASWIESMGLRPAGAPFAVYETDGGYDKRDVRVKIYLKAGK
jgi:predicted transcriptional regulator YdeE